MPDREYDRRWTNCCASTRDVPLTVVIGLPGSGKTRYLDSLVRDGVVANEHARDDYHAHAPDMRPESSLHFAELVSALTAGETCVIADVSFCYDDQLETVLAALRAQIPDLAVQHVYFANDPKSCAENVESDTTRNDRDARRAKIADLSQRYTPPAGARHIFTPSG
jgi:hypothetical protein